MIIDLFCGAGGWAEGARRLGLSTYGFDLWAPALATHAAAGHPGHLADVASIDPLSLTVSHLDGLIASPPCQGFSRAGKGEGRGDTPAILAAVESIRRGAQADGELAALRVRASDARSALVLEPLRWALDLEPDWVAWEQVTTVLPLWEACAEVLRADGYSVWTGNLHAEQYGVPQTRKRAVLIASRDREVGQPAPTHSRYHNRDPKKLDPGMPKWVSMAEALGWDGETGGDPRNRGERGGDEPAPTVTSKVDRNRWRPVAANEGTDRAAMAWVDGRPSPTIVGSFAADVVAAPGYRKAGDGPRQKAHGSVRVTVQEAAVLQTFPAGYPWQGGRSAQFLQIGNAVPPLLAAHVLAEAAGLPAPS